MSGLGPLARIAARDAWRARGRSALIVAMIALPVALATGASIVSRTTTPTLEERRAWEVGAADIAVGHEASAVEWMGVLPEGSRTVTFAEEAVTVVVRGEEQWATVSELPMDEPVAEGRLAVISGRAPESPGEAAVSPALLEAARAEVGSVLEVEGLPPLTVVGEAVRRSYLDEPLVLAVAGAFPDLTFRTSLVTLPPGASKQEVADLLMGGDGAVTPGEERTWNGQAQIVTYAESIGDFSDGGQLGAIFLFGGLMLFEAAIVAGAAFAVGARRQLRAFGLLASVGGEARHVRGLVMLGGVLLGGAGAVLGVSSGLLGAVVAAPYLDRLSGQYTGGLTVVWGDIAVIGVLGLVSALAAAFVPARAAARVSPLEALGGRRPVPRRTNERWARAGLVAVVAGAATVVAGSLGTASVALILAGTIAVVSGFAACAPLLVTSASRLASAAPATARIALRDIGRNAHRAGPSVAAVMSALTLAVALSTFITCDEARSAQRYVASMGADEVVIRGLDYSQPEKSAALIRRASALLEERLDIVASAPLQGSYDFETGLSVSVAPAAVDDGPGADEELAHLPYVSGGIVIGGRDVVDALGGDVDAVGDEEAPIIYGAGAWSDSGRLALEVHSEDGSVTAKDVVFVDADIPVQMSIPSLVMSPALAEELGINGFVDSWIVRTSSALTEAEHEAIAEVSEELGTAVYIDYERGYVSESLALRLAALAASAVTALGVLAVAVGLAAAESRVEWTTMSAVGMDPRARRSLAALQALFLGGLGSALALPGGLVPALGIAIGRDYPIVLPWDILAAVALGVPVIAAAGAWLLTRPPAARAVA